MGGRVRYRGRPGLLAHQELLGIKLGREGVHQTEERCWYVWHWQGIGNCYLCLYQWSNCADLAKEKCYKDWVSTDCRKSCGKCKGMTPAASNTCYDVFGNCAELAKTNCKKYASQCKKSCGKCEGMSPHKSNTCYDSFTNCASVCSWYTGSECNLACGKC